MIGIIAAMDCEINKLIEKLDNKQEIIIHNYTFYQGAIGKEKVVLVLSGIGKTNAAIVTTLLINNFDIRLIINTGIAGGIAPLTPGTLVIGTKLAYHDFDLRAFNYEQGQVPQLPLFFLADEKYIAMVKEVVENLCISYQLATILTGDQFLSTAKNIPPIFHNENFIAIDMEGAAIAHTCHLFQKPFLSLRIISDIIDTDNHVDNYFEFEQKAGEMSTEILTCILK